MGTTPRNKIIFIVLAVVVGIGIILIALFADDFFKKKERKKINDWIESLNIIPSNTSIPGRETLDINTEVSSQNLATTTTALLGQDVLFNTLTHQANSDDAVVTDENAQAIANGILQSTTDKNPVRIYSKSDLTIVPTSQESFDAYKGNLTTVFETLANTLSREDDLALVSQALNSQDPTKLTLLKTSITAYQGVITTLAKMPTPDIMSNVQLLFVQACSFLLSGVQDMSEAFSDPARGIVGVGKYNQGLELLSIAEEFLKNTH